MPRDAEWIPACVGIGSNLDDPARQVEIAIASIAALPATRLHSRSSLYRNPPLGPPEQPDYINAVAILLTRLEPHPLLGALQAIEAAQGRDRGAGPRWGPRIIDLDILTYGLRRIADETLTIPHPGIAERNFVLFPLVEVAPRMSVPGLGSAGLLASRVDGSALEKLDRH